MVETNNYQEIGAIIGDINGSKYEFHNCKSKDIELFQKSMFITDDSVLTLALMKVFNEYEINDEFYKKPLRQELFKSAVVENLIKFAKRYPHSGYGGMFRKWVIGYNNYQPYGSFGNGAAMRVSPVGWIAKTEEEVKCLSKLVTEVTHNHPEGLKGAEATALAIYLAKNKVEKAEIKHRLLEYYPEINSFDYDTLVKSYRFDSTCQGSVPQALYCFLISNSLEDCIRITISVGGDCDTTGAISCAVAGAYYGIPTWMVEKTLSYLPKELVDIVDKFEKLVKDRKEDE